MNDESLEVEEKMSRLNLLKTCLRKENSIYRIKLRKDDNTIYCFGRVCFVLSRSELF